MIDFFDDTGRPDRDNEISFYGNGGSPNEPHEAIDPVLSNNNYAALDYGVGVVPSPKKCARVCHFPKGFWEFICLMKCVFNIYNDKGSPIF